jgi:hypothetical protein
MKYFLAFVLCVLFIFSSCHTPTVTRGSDDPNVDERAISTGIDRKDWKLSLAQILQKLKTFSFYAEAQASGKKTVAVADFINESSNHIQVEFLRQYAEEELLAMGCFRLVEESKRSMLMQTLVKQNLGSSIFDASTVAQQGRQLGVQYFLQGRVIGHKERGEGVVRTQYSVVLEFIDVSTAERFPMSGDVSKQLE